MTSYLALVTAFGRLCGHTTQLTSRLATLLYVNVLLVVFSFPLVSPLVFILHIVNVCIVNYVWIYENGAKELKSRPKRAFFSRQKLSPKVTI